MVPPKNKTPMSEEERAALAKKLDDDLEVFIEEMAAKKKDEQKEKKPFDFDEFCKELDQHPAFMTDLQSGLDGQYADTIAALQAMKYDDGETEEEKRESVEGHKNEGNKHFKLKKYRWAVDAYTNGIKVRCTDRKLNAVLFQNRAAASAHIGNLRSAIKDCTHGRRFDPSNLKIAVRGAECLLKLGYAGDTVRWIDSSLNGFEAVIKDAERTDDEKQNDDKQRSTLTELRKTALRQQETEERDKRKKRAEEAKELVEKKKLLGLLEERKLNLKPRLPFTHPELFEWSLLEVNIAQLHNHERVMINAEGRLSWPLLIQYPEARMTDVMTECDESTMVGTLLTQVLAEPALWDPAHKYRMDNVTFFVSDEYDEYLHEVYPWTEFQSMFSYEGYQIKQGLPVLIVFTNEKVQNFLRKIDDKRFVVELGQIFE